MSSPTSPTSPSSARNTFISPPPSPWQNRLRAQCKISGMKSPVWELVSDKRGGRTAWSSHVTIGADKFHARYWYDGKFDNNAREDAAEVALQWMQQILLSSAQYRHN